jgi:hypothetical protein
LSMATDPPLAFDDPEHWRKRALDMRRVADQMGALPKAKESLLRIADGYDRLAARLTERVKSE